MINSIGTSSINPVNMFNALNAFKSVDAVPQEMPITDVSEGINLSDTNLLQNQNMDEIKEFAKIAGESNLSDEDIKYGVTYGRSVIADFVA